LAGPANQLINILSIFNLIGEGISVNVTLMFSLQHYDNVAEAYLAGLEKLAAAGGDLSQVTSVASFFVRRLDAIFDQALAAIGTAEAPSLRGKMGVANAKAAYRRFQTVFGSDRFKALAAKGPESSGRCGPAPASKTPPTGMCFTSKNSSALTPSTPCPRPPWPPSKRMAEPRLAWPKLLMKPWSLWPESKLWGLITSL
jgi:hypothetical protein